MSSSLHIHAIIVALSELIFGNFGDRANREMELAANQKRQLKIERFKRMIFHHLQKRGHHCDIALLSADGRTRYVI